VVERNGDRSVPRVALGPGSNRAIQPAFHDAVLLGGRIFLVLVVFDVRTGADGYGNEARLLTVLETWRLNSGAGVTTRSIFDRH